MSRALLRDALWRQLGLAVAVMLAAMLLLALAAHGLLRGFEQQAWRGRQAEAAEAAAASVGRYVLRAEDAIRFAGVLDGVYLEAFPDALEAILDQDDLLLELLRVDASGEILATARRGAPVLAEQFTIAEASWFREAAAGRRYLSAVQQGATPVPSLLLALPALDGGVVVARLRSETLWDAVDAFRFGEGGRAYVVDREGRLLAHSDPDRVLASFSLEGRPELAALRSAPAGRWSGAYRNFEGLEVLAATAPVGAAPAAEADTALGAPAGGGEWYVFAELPRDEAFAWSRLAWRWLTGALALLGLLTLAATAWLLAQLIWPLRLAPLGLPLSPAVATAGATEADALGQTQALSRRDIEALRGAFDDMYNRVTDIDRLTSEFLATVSHELRTPLNSVIGYAELILGGLNGPLEAEMQQDVEAIYENGQLLLRLVNDLLDLAKIEAGRLELELVRIDPAGLLEATRAANTRQLEQKGLALALEPAPDLPLIWGDPLRLQQVLDNLVSNAIKFTEAGEVRLAARREGDWLVIAVSDTGIGISEADRETIFERFRQLDGSFTRRAEGTGLGLAISRHLVRMHGGRIEVESQPGAGSTFRVLLPIEETPSHSRGLAIGTLL
ncbi:MAG: sensor histidine kinase [Caldilineae bacterium]|nr:sensor histidine kinase [Caldilineae bacterium]